MSQEGGGSVASRSIDRAINPATASSKDPDKRLEIREIIAMPRTKTKQD